MKLWYENEANVFALFLAFDARTGTMREVFDSVYKPLLAIGKEKYFALYLDAQDNERMAKIALDKVKDEEWWEEAKNEIFKRADALITFSETLKDGLDDKSDEKLAELYSRYVKLFKEMRIYSSLPTMLDHKSNMFTNHLQQKLKEYDVDMHEVFGVLTTPENTSYLLDENIERLELAKKIGKRSYEELNENHHKLLEEHTERWCWKEFLFEGKVLTKKDFHKQIQEDVSKEDPEKQIKDIKDSHRETLKKKDKIIEKHGFTGDLQHLINVGSEIVYLKYFRKGVFAKSYHRVEFLLEEIGKRLNITLDEVRTMLEYEVVGALDGEALPDTKKRLEEFAFISENGRSRPIDVEKAKELITEDVEDVGDEIKGDVACPGDVEGRACIVNDERDLEKMQEGDILVSIMTNPNLYSAMKKAAGIVTDVGGLSCHAAIVARELGIPCIVGTNHATKVIEDGMRIRLEKGKVIIE